ncbi:MAG TPA: antibiotic biosynthesis monooxygenase family protein [Chitinophagales bacterium]|nr:antibiotic biosynthesis monooxygenase family protein [Chitinophagales bacterium]
MLVRIVKMTFAEDKVENFVAAFNERKHLIAAFEGCSGVELLRDINDPRIFFTYSRWDGPESLEKYRQSELFNTVWDTVKKWFAGKPEAWSVRQVD